jgi:hypothetical protein
MEFDKPDKEVQRPRGNDVADQACSRLYGWRGEFCEASSVAAAVSVARGARRSSPVISSSLRFGLAVPA